MRRFSREITKEQYDRAAQNGNRLRGDDIETIFSEAERWGYGVYAMCVFEKDGKYWVGFSLGETCD